MARTKQLDNRHIEYLRAQIGSFINTHPHPALQKGATFLTESLEVWTVRSADFFSRPPVDIDFSRALVNTGNWHHQLSQGGIPVGYAISGLATSFAGGWTLRGLFVSNLAKQIGRAIETIDRLRPQDDIEAHYLTIPSHKMVLFYLRGYSSEEVFVVKAMNALAGPKEGEFYAPHELVRLCSQSKPVRGLKLNKQITLRTTSPSSLARPRKSESK